MKSTRIWFHTAQIYVARVGVCLAALLGFLGYIITFYPGAELGWFGVAAIVALSGLLSRTRRLRVVSVVLAVTLAWSAWGGHKRGRQYREWLRLPAAYHLRTHLDPSPFVHLA
jgi:hypothetical protein